MNPAYTVAEIRAAEAQAIRQIGGPALMRRAAHGLALEILKLLRARLSNPRGARVLVLAGPGNNGGDGLFAAAELAPRNIKVDVVQVGEDVHRSGWWAAMTAGCQECTLAEAQRRVAQYDLVIDAILGIGGRPGLSPEVADFAAAVATEQVVAVDLPSGLPAEPPFTGEPFFSATLTVTFGGLKPVHLLQPGRQACGEVVVVDIGLTGMDPLLWATDVARVAELWPKLDPLADKYSRGVVGILAGSARYPGAAVLATAGAVYAGAGFVRCFGPEEVTWPVLQRFPNVVLADYEEGELPDFAANRVDALVLGPGWGDRPDGLDVIQFALGMDIPLVIDADGLRYLPYKAHADTVLTPHAGELARLLGQDRIEVETDPIPHLRQAAEGWDCTVLLKGANQLVVQSNVDGIDVPLPGPAWTAQAGSGDVLSGVIGALLAKGTAPGLAATLGASLQALTATTFPGPIPPQELAAKFPEVISGLSQVAE
jgi:hydroxyethylthiazole kinase-like uncharacterized protein yjeF